MYDDPIVDEVRKTRERLSKKHNYEIGAIFEDLRKRQRTLGKRLVHRKRKEIIDQAFTPNRNSGVLHPGR